MDEPHSQIKVQGDVISLAGALTHSTVNAIYHSTPTFVEADYQVDLREVKKVDSAAFALLIIWRERAARNSSNLRFRHIPDRLREIAQLANLASILD